jgi:hypothetical protein
MFTFSSVTRCFFVSIKCDYYYLHIINIHKKRKEKKRKEDKRRKRKERRRREIIKRIEGKKLWSSSQA